MNRPRVRGFPPNLSALIAWNSDTGSAKNVAFTSARNAPHSTGVRRMNASPSRVSASPDRGRSPSSAALSRAAPSSPAAGRTGGIAGSLPTPHSAPAKDTTSAR